MFVVDWNLVDVASVKEDCEDALGGVKTADNKTVKLPVRGGGCVIWQRLVRLKSLGSERQEKHGQWHDWIGCGVN